MSADEADKSGSEPIGDYVHDPAYLEMRLRMLVTGGPSPYPDDWAAGLERLLAHLEDHPLPERNGTAA